MYTSFQLGKKYLNYYFTALNGKGHGMHSPFVFDFILRVLNNRNGYHPSARIEQLREKLLREETVVQVNDLGAGSRISSARQKKVKELAATALKPKKYGQVLYRLARHYQPNLVVELGTSLGITTAYLADARPSAEIHTIEGSEQIAVVAKRNFGELGIGNIVSHTGNFDSVLPELLAGHPKVDLAYVDGNHRYEPTLAYFHQLRKACGNDSILVFDDIHWSPDMEKAWKEISDHPSVTCSLDIFFLGFVFFRSEFKEKQQFTIRF